ncbi:hypothetical protein JHJ32_07660 [Parapedobacter sp. ISTM3]|uniref:hypothetical protein n=1 Tax=Parapedobacter sp. ISTM3 TaxID=2800130 RepID=UPI0019048818|nr:hypothetical protein [Parapedobacter sp. ISTM3]MBK1439854.1 hypothetical protein [Parapedobacter sp. ISTM3]
MDTNQIYEEIYFMFREIDPEKRFSEFSYYDVDKPEDLPLYLEDGLIIKYENAYFQCKRKKRLVNGEPPRDTRIEFKYLRASKRKDAAEQQQEKADKRKQRKSTGQHL